MKIKLLMGCLACILVFSLVLMSCSSTPSTTLAPPKTTAASSSTAVAPSATAPGPSTTAAGPTIKLKFANYFPPTSDLSILFQNYCKDIESQSSGQVQITYYPGGTLFDGPGTPDGIKTGIADMGLMSTGQVAGRFPVSEAITVMNGFPDAYVVSHVSDDFYRQYTPKEWADYKVLIGFGFSPMVIFSNKPIATLADYAGTKSRVLGRQADQAKLLGASPVAIPVADSFDALSKGVIDNSATSLEAAKTWRLAEATKYLTLTWPVFSPPCYYVIMNANSYNNLPSNVKAIVDKVSADYMEKSAITANQIDVVGSDYAKQMKMQISDLSPAEAAKWQALVAPLIDTYTTNMIGKGFTKADVQSWVDYIKARTAYWLQQQIKNGIKSPMGPPEVKG